MYQPAPAAHMNSFPSKQALEACQNWVGMSLPGSSAECSGDSDASLAGLGNTDTSLSPDQLAMLAWKSVLEASSHDFSRAKDSIPLPSLHVQRFDDGSCH
ncbi:hypothetical protein ABBQ32_012202 [Trebouxia sp. C0010 RCD-2024]